MALAVVALATGRPMAVDPALIAAKCLVMALPPVAAKAHFVTALPVAKLLRFQTLARWRPPP